MMLQEIKSFAERQSEEGSYAVSFPHNGTDINNPWLDPTGRFPLSDEEAVQMYGEAQLWDFCAAAEAVLTGNQQHP